MNEAKRKIILVITLVIIAGAIYLLGAGGETGLSKKAEIKIMDQTQIIETKSKEYERAKELVRPAGFINTDDQPIKIADYIGKKVILIDFWTYSCINCQRTQPYLNAWHERYANDGLQIIGIHSPEFDFEKVYDNVLKATRDAGIKYPVILDNDHGTWAAYQNRYWPRKYLIDIDGFIVYDHIGEGEYEETEMKIKELLAERAERLGEEMVSGEPLAAATIEEVKISSRSPETYFGANRNEHTAQGLRYQAGNFSREFPEKFDLNTLYHSGDWRLYSEYAESVNNARIAYRYNAKEVYLVASADEVGEIEVWQDGELVGEAKCGNGICEPDLRGADVNEAGLVKVGESRLYKLINNPAPGEHLLELRLKQGGIKLYAFTFG